MNEDSRKRLNAALDVIRKVYQTVDESLCRQEFMQAAYDSLRMAGKTGCQARRILARELCAGISSTESGYAFCEQAGMDQIAMLYQPMNLKA